MRGASVAPTAHFQARVYLSPSGEWNDDFDVLADGKGLNQ
jgi:hypothetical protein